MTTLVFDFRKVEYTKEMKEWCDKHAASMYWNSISDPCGRAGILYYHYVTSITFLDKEDALAFKLRFGL
jgi:hypothetical protein